MAERRVLAAAVPAAPEHIMAALAAAAAVVAVAAVLVVLAAQAQVAAVAEPTAALIQDMEAGEAIAAEQNG
jgi:hypothetical protein